MIRRFGLALLVGLAACGPVQPADPEYGVSLELAQARAQTISALRYDLRFAIPPDRTLPVTGSASISFSLTTPREPLILDFRGDSTSIADVAVNGTPITPRIASGHIVFPAGAMRRGANTIVLSFTSSAEALNRQDEFLYALFVPDRAASAFPSFDQPDLKARYRLQLDLPNGWAALANGVEERRDSTADGVSLAFGETEPISTYLFAFAAGRFQVVEEVRDGRTLTMYHRETDTAKVARNRDAIFDLHASALRWLEEYTGIPYPFGKFAFFAVPAFQFGGMEHPGAVWYRASSLFLDPAATQNQYLGRASLIAHETAHMWFGDLVTMRWFSDVWMKEVFANFMAAKIVQPSFPDVNHDLRFLLAHHPAAYAVDRTLGANPIRQDLENLRQAGSLYGAIIYQKAPIVMRQLERMVGDSVFREGLRRYLERYRFGNATWPDLVAILDELSPDDLVVWSRAWVEEPFRPQLLAHWTEGVLHLTQRDPRPDRGLLWPQPVEVALGFPDTVLRIGIQLAGRDATPLPPHERPAWILPGSDAVSYGRFILDSVSRATLPEAIPTLADPVLRSRAWLALWEDMLAGGVAPATMLDALSGAVAREEDDLVLEQALGLLRAVVWRFLSDGQRMAFAPRLEQTLWTGLERAETSGRKAVFWNTLLSVTLTEEGTARLRRIWRDQAPPSGLPLSESQYTALAEALALRTPDQAEQILDRAETRITNPDRRARFAFVRPALAADPALRDSVFASFHSVENRRRESWVLDALRYLAHPLRARHAEAYLQPGLDLLPEIQRTGDIFFPLNWLNALLDGHQTAEAADVVARHARDATDLDPRLRGKLLQAADDLYRAARIVSGWRGGPRLESDPLSP